MALRRKIEMASGIVVDSAYIKISSLNLSKEDMSIHVSYFVEGFNIPIINKHYECKHDIEGVNSFIQAYNHLKTLPEFSDSIDC